MAKWWFALGVGVPTVLLSYPSVFPGLKDLLPRGSSELKVVWAVMGVGALAVLAYSGSQFFIGAWRGLRHRSANMYTLIAMGTAVAWLYSTTALVFPGVFPNSRYVDVYYDVSVVVTALVVLGMALEVKARGRSSEAIRKLVGLQAKTARVVRDGQEVEIAVEDVQVGDVLAVRLLALVAAVEQTSEHPLAGAIVTAAHKRQLRLPAVEDFRAVPGHGVRARVGGHDLLLGNRRLMDAERIDVSSISERADTLAAEGKTPMFAAIAGRAAGLIAVADTIKDDSIVAIARLKALGLEVAMLTGDNQRTADAIARRIGVDRVLAAVLQQDKAAEVRKLQLEGRKVGMVGDGINDAPALTQADVGFAIGTGTVVAIEAADVTLISGSLGGVVTAIELSRATMRNVRQNLTGAFAYNSLGLPIALGVLYPILGVLLSPLLAAAAMSFSSVTVITNANRLKRWHPKQARR